MNNADAKNLCMKLAAADSEEDVISVLSQAKLWDKPDAWRLYGDNEGNFSTANNQQSRPEAALVEKIVNSVDARLLNECLVAGISPESADAPPSIKDAVAMFFEEKKSANHGGGSASKWPKEKQRSEARNICVAVSGAKPPGAACISIVDRGEGQTPARMADTFLSLSRSNKLRIHFVQGKFNMGGTGALRFCGVNKLQLVITRRNPKIVQRLGKKDKRDDEWSFTVVRREKPKSAAGEVRNSTFKYLAPIGAEDAPAMGQVLSFKADTLPLMPEGETPLKVALEHGSYVKLYNYDMKGFRSDALRADGLLYRLELLLPEVALPIRVHECRGYGGHSGSHDTTLVGTIGRLKEDHDNLEAGYPTSVSINIDGQQLLVSIFAFTGQRAKTYTKNEGVLFVVNGQTHGYLPQSFYSRKSVKMGRLADSLLAIIDCSQISTDAREDLFMSSRDRLSDGKLRKAIEEELEDVIAKHPGLRALRDKRKFEENAARLDDSKPLEEVFKKVLKSSPSLEKLFLFGQRLSRPHKSGEGNEKGGGEGKQKGAGPFQGKKHPSFFRLAGKKAGEDFVKNAGIDQRCRIRFETDVENNYFTRDDFKGAYEVEVIDGLETGKTLAHTCNLHDGVANWSISIPGDTFEVGTTVRVQCTVRDDTLLDPFVNVVTLRIIDARESESGSLGQRAKRTSIGDDEGKGEGQDEGSASGTGENFPGGLAIPQPTPVRQADWDKYGFDKGSACKVILDETDGKADWSYYVNVDNEFLRTDMKFGKQDAALLEKKFLYANVIVALAMIHDDQNTKKTKAVNASNEDEDTKSVGTIEDKILHVTRSLAPFLVPMIDVLGSITGEDQVVGAQQGDTE